MDKQLEAIMQRTGRLSERQQAHIASLLADLLDLAEKSGKPDRDVYRILEMVLDLAEHAPHSRGDDVPAWGG